jgi:hypothetical protein
MNSVYLGFGLERIFFDEFMIVLIDRRVSSTNSTTTIVAVGLSDKSIQGKNLLE